MSEIINQWPIVAALIATGIFAGILAGLFGVGGGIVIVPVLYFLLQGFGVSPESAMMIATATSLATIVPTSLSSIRSHHSKGNIDLALIKYWAPFILVMAVVGSIIAHSVRGNALVLMFACIAILVSLNMLFRAGAPALVKQLPGKFGQGVMASIVGGLSVMIGIGGGTIGVPMLNAFNVRAHVAVGTAAVFGLLIALPGVITLLSIGTTPTDAPLGTWGLVNLPAFFLIIPLTILFAPIGVKIGSKLDQKQLKRAFAVVLMITGIRMLIQTLGA
ncbi:sulfite exporter TauE/SafE family protein [Pseudoalteromonas sp. NZS127_1]|uniref:sulfite exporter TauE/SafE family protein n=1 Tax=Pseudoalteromonas TaxID=53246 RepID=UPI00140D30CD|nr:MULTISPECIES: sulfite exporter TauE/SafE family protein [Pseudoalteromonas]MBG9995942.1 sulfite exporter TauE/SafE family protein [Pseudoalteromonas sp. NZS127_1]MBH0012684.1 sulfite exporter TauE/SafE family protein [Pseudoalteromonas sp. NZS100_1]